MKIGNISVYAPQVSHILEVTDQTGEKMGELFEPLKKDVQKGEYNDVDLNHTKEVFQNGTNVYKQNLKDLEGLAVPVKVIGKHKSLTAAYSHYVDACQLMVDSINLDQNNVNADQFNDAEQKQTQAIQKVIQWTQKIMA